MDVITPADANNYRNSFELQIGRNETSMSLYYGVRMSGVNIKTIFY